MISVHPTALPWFCLRPRPPFGPGAAQPNAPIGRLSVGGDVLSGVYVRATDDIDELFVGGDVEDGAVIEADQIDDLRVDGNIFGDILRR